MAEVTYSTETQLKYIERITFLQNSAWPFNSSGNQWHRGDIKTFYVTGKAGEGLEDNDNPLNFVLIREGGNGVKPMWCAITNNSYKHGRETFWQTDWEKIVGSSYCPALSTANTISDILCSDWSYFMSKFNEAGDGKLEWGSSYYIDDQSGSYPNKDQMFIYDRKEKTGCTVFGQTKERFLLKIDWLKDGERTFLVTNSSKSIDNYGPENLFDGSCETRWQSYVWWMGDGLNGRNAWWVEFQTDSPFKPRAYQLWTTNMSGQDWVYYRRLPNQWALYAKKNSRSKWELLDSRSTTELPHKNYDGWGHTFTNVNSQYQFFRFEVYSHWWDEQFFELGQLKVLE